MRLALYCLLRFLVQEKKFEFTWLPQSVTDKDFVNTKKRIGYLLTEPQILRLLDSFPTDDLGNKWRFAFQCMAVYGQDHKTSATFTHATEDKKFGLITKRVKVVRKEKRQSLGAYISCLSMMLMDLFRCI